MSWRNHTIMTFVMQYMTNSLFPFIFIYDKIKPYRKAAKFSAQNSLKYPR